MSDYPRTPGDRRRHENRRLGASRRAAPQPNHGRQGASIVWEKSSSGDNPRDARLFELARNALWTGDGARITVGCPDARGGLVIVSDSPQDANVAQNLVRQVADDCELVLYVDNPEELTRQLPTAARKACFFAPMSQRPSCVPAPCAACWSMRHQLADCLHAADDGYMHGCPVCNDLGHEMGECPRTAALGLGQKVEWLITTRANKPPFATQPEWPEILREYLRGRSSALTPTYLPWTVEFSATLRDVSSFQRQYDQHRDSGRLPIDPATKDWATARESFGLDHE